MAAGQAALQTDHQELRRFIEEHTSGIDLDVELLKIASANEAFAIDQSAFVMLLRMNPVNESQALEAFMRLSASGDQITAEDCRTGLFQIVQSVGGEGLVEKSEQIIDAVMVDAGLQVSMEQWVGYSKTAGRIARLAKFAA
ncbi:unnamed protein product [Effrenium voratum]|nr:unnamed protein product [Effrenium voratum]